MPNIVNEGNIRQRVYAWIDDRLKLATLVDYMSHKVVPRHRGSIWYYFGGMTLFFFVVQVVTGILLLLYYRPGADSAYESVKFIISEVTFGWLIRALHSWSANLMILAAFLHMFSVFFTDAYRKPREMTWISGVILLGLALMFGFSGYLLPWNQLSFFATRVGTGMAGAVPVVGNFLLTFMRGGDDVTGATIGRFSACTWRCCRVSLLCCYRYTSSLFKDRGCRNRWNGRQIPMCPGNIILFFRIF